MTEKLGDWMRFVTWACLAIDGLIVAVFSVWLVARLFWRTAQWLEAHVLGTPW